MICQIKREEQVRMEECEYSIPGGSLYYNIYNGKAAVTRIKGLQSEVTVPSVIDGYPVISLEKKAFLSKKYLHRIQLPDGIAEIGDWAFAYCDHLEEVRFPDAPVRLGKAAFLGCHHLDRLCVAGKGEDVAFLLAAAARYQVSHLVNIAEAGSTEWMRRWDLWMLSELHASDTEGYSKQVLCGEEDYGSTDLNAYIQGRRKEKVRLVLLRLCHAQELSGELRREMEEYMRSHTKGCESEESWLVILEEYGEKRPYYQMFAELGCITAENMEGILADMGDAWPEMKAYFLRYKEEQIGYTDFFETLDLDF